MTKSIARTLWWATYIAGAILLQKQIPGIDALAPGFLLSLQEKRPWQTLILFFLFCLIQEGAGTLRFGGAPLWYAGQALFFWLGQRFFVADNVFFVSMLAIFLGCFHAVLILLMCEVQEIPVEYATLIHESIIQMLLIPLIWGLAYHHRPRSNYSKNFQA